MNQALCQQQRIAGGRCTNRSAFRFTWPGRTESTICQTCVHKLRNLAAAMGLELQLLPYEEPARDTQPAPPLNEALEAEDDPAWMRETQPGELRKPYKREQGGSL